MLTKKVIIVFALVVSVNAAGITCPTGTEIYSNTMSAADRTQILDLHNNYRTDIMNGNVAGQPQGTNLYKMAYNMPVEATTSLVANTCQMVHNNGVINNLTLGQNLHMDTSSDRNDTIDWLNAFTAWTNESQSFKYPNINTGTGEITHYTQVVWAMNTQLGCVCVNFMDPTSGPMFYKRLYICNYGPVGGNTEGQAPYNVHKNYLVDTNVTATGT